MSLSRRLRYTVWFTRELFHKYSISLGIGLSLGLAVAIMVWKFIPFVSHEWFTPIIRIGVVGEYSPTTLPLFIQKQLSLGLTQVGENGLPGRGLASSWEIQDFGKTYVFTLRDDYVWHGADLVKAKDVNYNIKNVTFTPLGDTTLKATLGDSYSPFLTLVAKPIVTVGLRGFGPYKVSALKLKGEMVQRLRLQPTLEQDASLIEYRFYKTETQALLAYQLGDIDELHELSNVQNVINFPNTLVTQHETYDQIVGLYFNLKNPIFADKSVRQGLWLALPPATREPVRSPLHKGSWAYDDVGKKYDSNEALAKKLLMGSSIASPGGTLTISTFSYLEDTAQVIAATWTRFGIPTSVKVENVVPTDFEMFLTTASVPIDPDQYPYWHSTQPTNITHYANVKIDKLLEDGRKELDIEKRKKIYADFQRYLMEDAPVIFLYYPTLYSVQRK